MEQSTSATLFDEEFLRKLEYLKLVSTRMIPGRQRGEHRSRKKGTGIEFADYRAYVPGDDTKDVDWKAYLRLNKLLIRIFDEEADLPIYLFVDASKSMGFGSPPKFDYGRRMAAALCYMGLLNLDRVSVSCFSDGLSAQIASKRGRNQVWRIFKFLDHVKISGETNLEKAFRSFFGSKRRRGLVVAISDFLDPQGFQETFDFVRFFGHDVLAIELLSHEEVDPSFPDEALLVDAETGGSERVRSSPGLLAAYQKAMDEHHQQIDDYCSRYGWGYVRSETTVPFEDLVVEIFKQDRFIR